MVARVPYVATATSPAWSTPPDCRSAAPGKRKLPQEDEVRTLAGRRLRGCLLLPLRLSGSSAHGRTAAARQHRTHSTAVLAWRGLLLATCGQGPIRLQRRRLEGRKAGQRSALQFSGLGTGSRYRLNATSVP